MHSQSGIDFLASLAMSAAVAILIAMFFMHISSSNARALSQISNEETSSQTAIESMVNAAGVLK